MHMQCIQCRVCLGVSELGLHTNSSWITPLQITGPPSRFRFGCILDIGICEILSKPNMQLLLNYRKLILSQLYAYPFNVLPSLCWMWLWKEYIHCWCFAAVKCNLCVLYYSILCYCMYSMLYYQYHVACPKNQTDQICHAEWGCSVEVQIQETKYGNLLQEVFTNELLVASVTFVMHIYSRRHVSKYGLGDTVVVYKGTC